MIPRWKKSWTALVLAALAGASLAGCGKQGDLERPAPLFGHVKAPSAETLARDEAAARARTDGLAAAGPQALAPQSVDEVRDQGLSAHKTKPSDPGPSSTVPPGRQ